MSNTKTLRAEFSASASQAGALRPESSSPTQGVTGAELRERMHKDPDAVDNDTVGGGLIRTAGSNAALQYALSEKKRKEQKKFARDAQDLNEYLDRIADIIADLRAQADDLRNQAKLHGEKADALAELADAIEKGEALTPDQQKMVDQFRKKYPDASDDLIVHLILQEEERQRRKQAAKNGQADDIDDKIKSMEELKRSTAPVVAEIDRMTKDIDERDVGPEEYEAVTAMVKNLRADGDISFREMKLVSNQVEGRVRAEVEQLATEDEFANAVQEKNQSYSQVVTSSFDSAF